MAQEAPVVWAARVLAVGMRLFPVVSAVSVDLVGLAAPEALVVALAGWVPPVMVVLEVLVALVVAVVSGLVVWAISSLAVRVARVVPVVRPVLEARPARDVAARLALQVLVALVV
ncbi:hypothetical protein NJB1604_09970 [Mycobacterium marinum]|nr:hypothetical protein NJB1604_09970 [Mycobacterium marinum]